ncbi:MAG TPA: DUF4231 domain-containing protein [Ktedonobacterales bacterium]
MQAEPGAQGAQPTLTLDDKDLPALFEDSDTKAVAAQNVYFTWLELELILLGLGVLVGAFNGAATSIGPVSLMVPPFAVAGVHITKLSAFEIAEALLLLAALLARVVRIAARPEKMWYEARAVAESVKSIAWRYAVGGEPFDLAHSPETLATIVADRFRNIRTDLSKYRAPEAVVQQEQVTPRMAEIRKLPLERRKAIYRDGRVMDQQKWYTKKAAFNKSRAWQSHAILIVVEVLAVIAALLPIALTAFHIFPLNLQSLMANIAGGGAAWMTAKRYEDLNASYSVTANELRKVAADSEKPQDEAAWGRFVENAEGAMSREHQLWRATRVD